MSEDNRSRAAEPIARYGEGPARPRDDQWHLDRKVPLAIIMAIAAQTVAVVWGAATLSARVEVLEKQATAITPLAEKVIRLETRMEAIQQGIAEIKTLVRARQAGAPP